MPPAREYSRRGVINHSHCSRVFLLLKNPRKKRKEKQTPKERSWRWGGIRFITDISCHKDIDQQGMASIQLSSLLASPSEYAGICTQTSNLGCLNKACLWRRHVNKTNCTCQKEYTHPEPLRLHLHRCPR